MALTLPKLTVPKLALPTLSMDRKKLLPIIGAVVILAAAGWFGWDYFMEEPAPPPPAPKPQAMTAKKPAPAKPTADSPKAREQLVADVIKATGLKLQLERLPQRLAAGAQQADKPTLPAMAKTVEDLMAKAYSAEGFQAQVEADLKKNFDQKRLQALLKEFSTPAAKAMVGMEGAAHSMADLARFAGSKDATQPAPARAALIQRIDSSTKAGDLAVDVAFAWMDVLAQGMAKANPRKTDAIGKEIEKQRASADSKIRDATQLNLAFSFKDASDADLAKFAGIYEGENSKWFYNQVYASLLTVVKKAAAEASMQVAALDVKPAVKHTGAKSHADARACLKLASNAEVIKCAEAYR